MQENDFVEIAFTGRVEGSGEVFDTTEEALAKQAGISLSKPGPVLVIVGSPMMVPGVTEQLREMQVGEERTFSVPIAKAFGPRRPMAVKVISLAKFLEKRILPTTGEVLEIDGARAKVLSVSGGRVRADFNHPLSGKALSYWVKVVSQVTEPLEKARKLLDYYGIPCEAALAEGKLRVVAKAEVPALLKKLLEQKLTEHVKEITSVEFAVDRQLDAGKSPASGAEKPPEGAEKAAPAGIAGEIAEKPAATGANQQLDAGKSPASGSGKA